VINILAAEASQITLPLKRFMLIEQCPLQWQALDLYLFRDEDIVFYVGQSALAFERVWEHLRSGFRGRSLVGRFILCNWPTSLSYSLELMSSQAEQFASVGHQRTAAEGYLIQHFAPCFNEALNKQPTPLPRRYTLPNAKLRCSRSLNQLIREADRAVQADERRRWLREKE
jgi:hypothetical protein